MDNLKNIEIYEENILTYKDFDFTAQYAKCPNCAEYTTNFNGCELKVSIDTNTHIIENATVNECENDFYKLGVMKAFCRLIFGLPILEAHDHGVLRLEGILRKNAAHPVKGVIMPGNSCELFVIPLTLIRAIYNQYSSEQNYHPLVNTYTPKEIKAWKNLDVKEREKIVFEKIKKFCDEHNIKEYDAKLIGDMRVEFSADKGIYSSLAKLLFDMEVSIDNDLGFSLEIMFTEKLDANKKRQN